jgi:hypothetical protein
LYQYHKPSPETHPRTAAPSTDGASSKDQKKDHGEPSEATGASSEDSKASPETTTNYDDQVRELMKIIGEQKKEITLAKREATTAKNKVKQLNDRIVTQATQASASRRASTTAATRSSRSRSRNRNSNGTTNVGTTNVSFPDPHLQPGEVKYEITTAQSPEMYDTFWIVADNPSNGHVLTSKDAKYAICKKCDEVVAFKFRQPSSLQRHYKVCSGNATASRQRVRRKVSFVQNASQQQQRQRQQQQPLQQQAEIYLNASSQQQEQQQQQMHQRPPVVLNAPFRQQQQQQQQQMHQQPPTLLNPPLQQQQQQQEQPQERTYTLGEIQSLSKILVKTEKDPDSQDHEAIAPLPRPVLHVPQPVFSAAPARLLQAPPTVQHVPLPYYEPLVQPAEQYYQEATPYRHHQPPQRPQPQIQYLQLGPQGPPQYQQSPQYPPHQFHPPPSGYPNPNNGFYPGY